jgi:hypothetical protein
VAQSTPDRRPFSHKHRYARLGTYRVRAVWTDSSRQSGFRELTITVEPAPPGAAVDLLCDPVSFDEIEEAGT